MSILLRIFLLSLWLCVASGNQETCEVEPDNDFNCKKFRCPDSKCGDFDQSFNLTCLCEIQRIATGEEAGCQLMNFTGHDVIQPCNEYHPFICFDKHSNFQIYPGENSTWTDAVRTCELRNLHITPTNFNLSVINFDSDVFFWTGTFYGWTPEYGTNVSQYQITSNNSLMNSNLSTYVKCEMDSEGFRPPTSSVCSALLTPSTTLSTKTDSSLTSQNINSNSTTNSTESTLATETTILFSTTDHTSSTTMPLDSTHSNTLSTTMPLDSTHSNTLSTTMPLDSTNSNTLSTTMPLDSTNPDTLSTTMPLDSTNSDTLSTTMPLDSTNSDTLFTTTDDIYHTVGITSTGTFITSRVNESVLNTYESSTANTTTVRPKLVGSKEAKRNHKDNTALIAGAVSGGVLLLIIGATVVYVKYRRNSRGKQKTIIQTSGLAGYIDKSLRGKLRQQDEYQNPIYLPQIQNVSGQDEGNTRTETESDDESKYDHFENKNARKDCESENDTYDHAPRLYIRDDSTDEYGVLHQKQQMASDVYDHVGALTEGVYGHLHQKDETSRPDSDTYNAIHEIAQNEQL